MKNFELVQSFLGETTVYPSGVQAKDQAPFKTQNLEKVVSLDKKHPVITDLLKKSNPRG